MATLELLHARGEIARSRVAAYASRERELRLRDGTTVPAWPLAALPQDGVGGATLLHFAYRTREQATAEGAAQYVRDNVAITATVVDAIQRAAPAGVLLPSSGAVYTPGGGGAQATDLVANPYGTLKHLDELAFSALCVRTGAPLAIVRVFNVSGPHILKPGSFALGSLITAALAGEPLVVRARGTVTRSFVAIGDLVAVALAWLADQDRGTTSVTFDTAGDEAVEVGALAERVRRVLERDDLPIERSLDPAAPTDEYVGDGTAMRALAERYGIVMTSLDDQIRATAGDLALDRVG